MDRGCESAPTANKYNSRCMVFRWVCACKNGDMWSERLFNDIARLSQTNTTFATFTSAGDVRRQLQSAGFKVRKTAGFGKKREMLHGIYV